MNIQASLEYIQIFSEHDRQIRNAKVETQGGNYENRSHRRQWTHRIKACQQASSAGTRGGGGSSIPYSIIRATQFFEFVKGIADFSTDGNKVRLPLALIQPMAADDVASAVGRVATGSPVNGAVEVGGPEQFRLDELIRQGLAAHNDPREVVADPHARYYGVELSERTLLPGDDARLGETRFKTWLTQSAAQNPSRNAQSAVKTAGVTH